MGGIIHREHSFTPVCVRVTGDGGGCMLERLCRTLYICVYRCASASCAY